MGTLEERKQVIEEIFNDFDCECDMEGELSPEQLQTLHLEIRLGGISIAQVKASIDYACATDRCDKSELFDVLKEMDRRYYLVQDLRWEFSMLDIGHTDSITEEQARWFVQTVHGKFFSKRRWEKFVKHRAIADQGVTFPEMEVMLCDVPSAHDLQDDAEEDKRERKEFERKYQELERRMEQEMEKKKRQNELERKQREANEKKRRLDEEKRRKEEEIERARARETKEDEEKRRRKLEEDEERGRQEAEQRKRKLEEQKQREEEQRRQEFLEAQRLRELEEKHRLEEEERKEREEAEALKDEIVLQKAMEDEKAAEEEAEHAARKLMEAQDGRAKKEAEDEERAARLRVKENRNLKVRYKLKVAVKTRDMNQLPKAVEAFKRAKLPDDDTDLAKAERILKQAIAKASLREAMDKRALKKLEEAINTVKKQGFEVALAKDMLEANKIKLQLRRLERIRAEILELKQSTVAEIRSYQKPPAMVHTVMTATFLILGHKEKETKVWKTVQALVGKTGKEGLKRRCVECEPLKIDKDAAKRAKELFHSFSLDEVRDVSAGTATFFVWGTTMIDEHEEQMVAKASAKPSSSQPSKQRSATPSGRGRNRSPSARTKSPARSRTTSPKKRK